MLQDPIYRIRIIALIEGVSFLLLLGIAMPLKHFAGMPLAVKYVGWAHGGLFIALALVTFYALARRYINFQVTCMVALASILPFGPFLLDGRLKELEVQRQGNQPAAPAEA